MLLAICASKIPPRQHLRHAQEFAQGWVGEGFAVHDEGIALLHERHEACALDYKGCISVNEAR